MCSLPECGPDHGIAQGIKEKGQVVVGTLDRERSATEVMQSHL
jgi:hypothetical protein